MSSAVAFVSGPNYNLPLYRKVPKGAAFDHHKTQFFTGGPLRIPIYRKPPTCGSRNRRRELSVTPRRPFTPVMEWQDSRAEIEVDVPASVAYACYSDRELIPQWMPFISSVKVLKDKPELSRWSLKYEVLGRNVEFSWLARNMQPIPNQKIHWRSLEGLPNKGAVRFFPKGPSSCKIELTVSYEVPQILAPVASALQPFSEGMLYKGLERFAKFAREYGTKVPQS